MVKLPSYKVLLHRKVISEDSRHFDRKTKDKIKKRCLELLSEEPEKVGAPLHGELSEYRKLKVLDDYRVIYQVDRIKHTVFVLVVGMRRDWGVYQEAMKRMFSQ